jgi:hypothetical protein
MKTGTLKTWSEAKEFLQKHQAYDDLRIRFIDDEGMEAAFYKDPTSFVEKYMPCNAATARTAYWYSLLRNWDEWYSETLPSYELKTTATFKDICRLRIPSTQEEETIAIGLIKKKYPYICGWRKTREYIIFYENARDYELREERI